MFATSIRCVGTRFLYILASSLVESTLLKTSLQQVVSGYLLAIAWVIPPAPPQENSRTISP